MTCFRESVASRRSASALPEPELLATGPNQLWSRDITKLRGPVKWSFYYLYVIFEVFTLPSNRESIEADGLSVKVRAEKGTQTARLAGFQTEVPVPS